MPQEMWFYQFNIREQLQYIKLFPLFERKKKKEIRKWRAPEATSLKKRHLEVFGYMFLASWICELMLIVFLVDISSAAESHLRGRKWLQFNP